MIQWKVDGERNKKDISKSSENKRKPFYSGISLFTMMRNHFVNGGLRLSTLLDELP
ncbi:MAG: hypothetical protein ACMUEL_01220 [Flavobacteriales bacterium Tduv]